MWGEKSPLGGFQTVCERPLAPYLPLLLSSGGSVPGTIVIHHPGPMFSPRLYWAPEILAVLLTRGPEEGAAGAFIYSLYRVGNQTPTQDHVPRQKADSIRSSSSHIHIQSSRFPKETVDTDLYWKSKSPALAAGLFRLDWKFIKLLDF